MNNKRTKLFCVLLSIAVLFGLVNSNPTQVQASVTAYGMEWDESESCSGYISPVGNYANAPNEIIEKLSSSLYAENRYTFNVTIDGYTWTGYCQDSGKFATAGGTYNGTHYIKYYDGGLELHLYYFNIGSTNEVSGVRSTVGQWLMDEVNRVMGAARYVGQRYNYHYNELGYQPGADWEDYRMQEASRLASIDLYNHATYGGYYTVEALKNDKLGGYSGYMTLSGPNTNLVPTFHRQRVAVYRLVQKSLPTSVKKISSDTGYNESKAGIQYAFYTNESDARARSSNYKGIVTLNEAGETITPAQLDPGNYYAIEYSLGGNTNYKLSNEIKIVKAGESVEFADDPNYGSAQLVKVSTDSNYNQTFADITYGLYKGSNATGTRIGTFTLNANGTSNVITDLLPGTYSVKELTTNKYYKLSTAVTSITVAKGELGTFRVSDPPEEYYAYITKNITGNATALKNSGIPNGVFKFKVTRNGDNKVMGTFEITFTAGKVTGDSNKFKLPVGTYTVEEISVPAGIVVKPAEQNKRTLTVTTANTESNPAKVTFTNDPESRPVYIHKTSSRPDVDEFSVVGIEFTLYLPDKTTVATTLDGKPAVLKVGADGNTQTLTMLPGNYWLVETKYPSYFTPITSRTITIPKGDNPYVLEYENSLGPGKGKVEKNY